MSKRDDKISSKILREKNIEYSRTLQYTYIAVMFWILWNGELFFFTYRADYRLHCGSTSCGAESEEPKAIERKQKTIKLSPELPESVLHLGFAAVSPRREKELAELDYRLQRSLVVPFKWKLTAWSSGGVMINLTVRDSRKYTRDRMNEKTSRNLCIFSQIVTMDCNLLNYDKV